MKKTRIISLLVAAAMLCTLLSGCVGGKTVMKIGGNAISEDIYSAALIYTDLMMQQNVGLSIASYLDEPLGDGKTGADMLKEQADSFIKEFESVVLLAKEKGISLDAEDKKTLKEAKQSQIDAAGGKKAFIDGLKADGLNEAFYDYMMERQQLYSKVYTELYTGDGEFAPSADEVIASLEGYVRVKHVLIKAEAGSEDYEAKKAEAQKIADRAKAGEDFEALIAEVAENGDGDPGMQSNTEGYVMSKEGNTLDGGSMIKEFSDASNALAVNAVSGVVPSSYGFHIIKRYPFDAAYITEHIDEYSYNVGATAITEQLMAAVENVEIEYTSAYDNFDIHAVFGVEKTLGAGTGEEHYEGDGHDHSAEGEAAPETEGGIEVGEAVPAQ